MTRNSGTKLPYQLRCKISGSVTDIENWLATYCEGAHEYSFEDIVETDTVFNQLVILFSFQHAADREKFKRAVKSGHI